MFIYPPRGCLQPADGFAKISALTFAHISSNPEAAGVAGWLGDMSYGSDPRLSGGRWHKPPGHSEEQYPDFETVESELD